MSNKNGRPQGAMDFPDLDSLMGGYFHQDCYMYGGTLADVVREYRTDAAREAGAVERTIGDIRRFLAERPDDERLAADLDRISAPQVRAEGWEAGITNWRQWLTHVAGLLAETPHAVNR